MRIKASIHLRSLSAMSLVEIVIAMGLTATSLGALVTGFVMCATDSKSTSYSFAAQSRALEGIELVRAAKWDTMASPVIDMVASTNFPKTNYTLNVPRCSKQTSCTNYTTITTLSLDPPLKKIRVDCVWAWSNKKLYTNSVVTYRGPDQ